jgi:hypothetical protein
MCYSINFVASGIGEWLHDGWGHSYPAGHRHHRVSGPTYSGTKNIVAIWTLAGEGEVFGKGLAMNHFTTNLQRGATTMKKRNIVIHCLVILMLIATFAACTSTSTKESTGEYVDDSVITTKVKALLANDDFFKSFQISVETYKGIVQLSGFVNSQQAVDKAGQIARSVQGVKSVKNNLSVK